MSISTKLQQLTSDITAAYNALEDVGATMPANKNTNNLASTINSVVPAIPEWGVLYYYSGFSQTSWANNGSTNITINSIDEGGLANFVEQRLYYPSGQDVQLDAWYWMDNGTLRCSWQSNNGWQQFTAMELQSQFGIDVSLIDTNTNGELRLNYAAAKVDKTSQINSVELSSQSEYENLGTSNNTFATIITIGSDTIMWGAIHKFVFGTNPTTTPNYFLGYSGVEEIDMSKAEMSSIGNNFLYFCSSLDILTDFPGSVTTIGSGFLSSCSAFNYSLDLSSVETLSGSFLANCSQFTSRILLPAVTSVGEYFMFNCSRYNSSIELPSATSIGNNFMRGCSKFNSTISIPEATTIGTYFLYQCTVFNQPISFPKIASIGNYFLNDLTNFNSILTFSSSLTSIGNYFLKGCTSYNLGAIFGATNLTTIGTYFLSGCTSLNKSFSIPSTVTSIGAYFMYNCNAMVSTLTLNCNASVAATSNYTLATSSSSAACYTTGITIAGSYASNWKSRFPNRTSSPYRKLI